MMAAERISQILGPELDAHWQNWGELVGLPGEILAEFQTAVNDAPPIYVVQTALPYLMHRFAQLTARNVATATDIAYLREVERWNLVGLWLLAPDRIPLAETLYAQLLLQIRELQDALEQRLHKGTPYHMLGYTRLLANDREAAHEYFLLAAFEDLLIDGEGWQSAPAAMLLAANWNPEVESERVRSLRARADDLGEEGGRLALWNPELLLLRERAT